jgi:hypothetical protein
MPNKINKVDFNFACRTYGSGSDGREKVIPRSSRNEAFVPINEFIVPSFYDDHHTCVHMHTA